MQLAQLQALVTPAQIRDALDDQIYRSLTGENGSYSGGIQPRPAGNGRKPLPAHGCTG